MNGQWLIVNERLAIRPFRAKGTQAQFIIHHSQFFTDDRLFVPPPILVIGTIDSWPAYWRNIPRVGYARPGDARRITDAGHGLPGLDHGLADECGRRSCG